MLPMCCFEEAHLDCVEAQGLSSKQAVAPVGRMYSVVVEAAPRVWT